MIELSCKFAWIHIFTRGTRWWCQNSNILTYWRLSRDCDVKYDVRYHKAAHKFIQMMLDIEWPNNSFDIKWEKEPNDIEWANVAYYIKWANVALISSEQMSLMISSEQSSQIILGEQMSPSGVSNCRMREDRVSNCRVEQMSIEQMSMC